MLAIGLGGIAHSDAVSYDALGRLKNPVEAFYANNPSPEGRKPIPEVDAYDPIWGETQLIQAVATENLLEVKRLLGLKANPNIRNASGGTPLEAAVRKDNLEIAKLLIRTGARANIGYPLFYAKSDAMTALLKKHGAIRSERPKPKIVLRTQEQADELNRILHQEEHSGKPYPSVTVAVLLDRPPETIRQLIQEGGNINEIHPVFGSPLVQAFHQDRDIATIAFLLQAGADPNLNGGYADWPLSLAVRSGYPDMVKLLLKSGAILQPRDAGGEHNLLMSAVQSGNVAVARLLIEAGAEPNEKIVGRDGKQEPPLLIQAVFYNASRDKPEMAQLLLEAGADPKAEDVRGSNALAVVNWYPKLLGTVKALLQGGVSPTHSSIYKKKAQTLLHWAITLNDQELFDMALKGGVDTKQRNKFDVSPLFRAVRESNPAFVRALLEAGAPVNKSVADFGLRGGRDDMLVEAVLVGNMEIINILIAAGVDLDTQGNNYRLNTALHLAVEKGREDIVRALLGANARVDVRDRYDRTPLFLAVKKKNSNLVKLLLKANANPNLQDKEGKNALYFAERYAKDTEIPATLRAAGK
jgi:ankyrin repeat protein